MNLGYKVVDLTSFLADCATATDYCKYSTYSGYDGTTLMSYWDFDQTNAALQDGLYVGLCLEDLSCFGA